MKIFSKIYKGNFVYKGMLKRMKHFFDNKISFMIFLFLVFGAITVIAGDTVVNNQGIETDNLNLSFLQGSVIFQDANGLTEDNANLFWDKDNKRLGVGTTTPGDMLEVNGQARFRNRITTYSNEAGKTDWRFAINTNNADVTFLYNYDEGGAAFKNVQFGGTTVSGTGVFVESTGNVGIGTATPSYPLEINGDNAGISLYTSGNISATGFITRTKLYNKNKDVWDYIKDTDFYKGQNGKIDHSRYYGFVENITTTDYSRPINESYEEEVCVEMQCQNEIRYRIIYPYTKEEQGVDLESEINLLRQAVYELKQELEELKK